MHAKQRSPATGRVRQLTGLLLAGLGLALAGCTSHPRVSEYRVSTASCCSNLSNYSFPALAPGNEVEFSLAPSTPTIAFDNRLAHFAGFEVPRGVVPSALTVKTYLSTGFLPKATAVAPEVRFFDDRLEPLGKLVVADMQSDKGFWRGSVSGRVPVPRGTRYIVIVPATGGSGVGTVRAENGTPYRLPAAALGDLSIRLYEEGPRR
jgi:hypothetical protein